MKEKAKRILGMLLAVVCVVAFAACGNFGAEEVAKYDLTSLGIKVLSNKGNVYYIGQGGNMKDHDKFAESLTKYLENVKQVVSDEVWIDNNGDLYLGGYDFANSEPLAEPKKIGSNIVMANGNEMGFLAVDKNGNLYSYGKEKHNGFDKEFKELTKIDDVKDVVKVSSLGPSNSFFVTLTKDGTVYRKESNGEFTKLMDNVKDIQGSYIIDKQGIVYYWSSKDVVKMAPKLQIALQNDIFNTVFVENNTISYYKWNGEKYEDIPEIQALYNHYPKDIKQVLFIEFVRDTKNESLTNLKLVYVNTNNEIVLYGVNNAFKEEGTVDVNTKVTRSLDDVAKIWEFIRLPKKN